MDLVGSGKSRVVVLMEHVAKVRNQMNEFDATHSNKYTNMQRSDFRMAITKYSTSATCH